MKKNLNLKQKRWLWLLPLFSLLLSGCSGKDLSRYLVRDNGETTVVIENTDNITPEKGAVLSIKRISNFMAYDFLSEETLLGYKYASTLFGEDRGVVLWDVNEGKTEKTLPFELSPRQLKLSPDKKKLLYIPDQTGGSKSFTVYNLEDNQKSEYNLNQADYFWAFNWFSDNTGGVVVSTSSQDYKLYTLDTLQKLNVSNVQLKNKENEFTYIIDNSLSKKDSTYSVAVGGLTGGLYQLAEDSGKFHLEPTSETLSISQVSTSASGHKTVVNTFEASGTGQKLWLLSPEGKRQTELYKANYFVNLAWSKDEEKLAFTAVEADGRIALYLADLGSGQVNFLGEYPGYGASTLAFSPNGSKLLMTYLNSNDEDAIWETQLLTIDQSGGY